MTLEEDKGYDLSCPCDTIAFQLLIPILSTFKILSISIDRKKKERKKEKKENLGDNKGKQGERRGEEKL